MNRTLLPGPRTGAVRIPASKSQAHRMLICAALSRTPGHLMLDGFSEDIEATMQCLRALGAKIEAEADGLWIEPPAVYPAQAALDAGESGSTLRFLLPVLGALGVRAQIRMHGRLPERPLSPLWELLEAHGMQLRREDDLLHVCGQLQASSYALPGNVSSQFVSGLLFALPLLAEDSVLTVTGQLQSARYVAMTEQALRAAGIRFEKNGQCWTIPGGQRYESRRAAVEGDWSNAAFLLALGDGVTVTGLRPDSLQGDRVCRDMLHRLESPGAVLDISACPDLGPILFAAAARSCGGVFTGTHRLRIKESDRIAAMAQELSKFGAQIREEEDRVTVLHRPLHPPREVLDGHNDHRIVMSLAVLCASLGGTIRGAEAVSKSWPDFFPALEALGLRVDIQP